MKSAYGMMYAHTHTQTISAIDEWITLDGWLFDAGTESHNITASGDTLLCINQSGVYKIGANFFARGTVDSPLVPIKVHTTNEGRLVKFTSESYLTTNVSSIPFNAMVKLTAPDSIKMQIRNRSSNENIDIDEMQFWIEKIF